MIHRVAVLVHLVVATLVSIIYVPFPEVCDAVMYHLVKNTERLLVNGESCSKQFCKCVQSTGEDSCSVVAENEQGDGEDGPDDEVQSGRDGELQSDGCKDD